MSDTTTVSPLRQCMIEDMAARKLNPHTQRSHIQSCKRFAAWLKRCEVRRFQLYLVESGMSICNRNRIMTGVRFARAAAPLVHGKPGTASVGGGAGNAGAFRGSDGFAIDIAEAKAFRDIQRRLTVLLRKRYGPSENGGPLTATEILEESELEAMISKSAAILGRGLISA